MIARATLSKVLRRCSIDSISQRADWIFFWMNSPGHRVGLLVLEHPLVLAGDCQLWRV